jgi:hypothetical protein
MGVIEGILAFIGLVALIVVIVAILSPEKPQQAPVGAPVEDLAAPYREGLYAAMRMQGAAHELEQQLYAEAVRHAHAEVLPPAEDEGQGPAT